jgi:Kef-type K+ transport system membrane component KefB
MGFGTLALVSAAGLLGPLLAVRSWRVPVVLGELVAGIVLGSTWLGWLNPTEPTFAFLANVGFALVMFVAGSHVPIRSQALRHGMWPGVARAAAVGLLAVALGVGIADLLGTGHALLYAVLMASSSAALILPIVDSLHLDGPGVLELLPQVAIADTACIVILPLVIDPAHALRAALGAGAVVAAALAMWALLGYFERHGVRSRVHRISERRKFALELRISLTVLFMLAAVAASTHVSIMLAGFAFGLVVAALGEPRRLAKQLFAITEGFLGPLFFIWLGASLQVRELTAHPWLALLGVLLAVGAVVTHIAMKLTGQPLPIGLLASAELGVPIGAAALATQLGLLAPGEASALILSAMLTIAAAIGAAAFMASPKKHRPTSAQGPGGLSC